MYNYTNSFPTNPAMVTSLTFSWRNIRKHSLKIDSIEREDMDKKGGKDKQSKLTDIGGILRSSTGPENYPDDIPLPRLDSRG